MWADFFLSKARKAYLVTRTKVLWGWRLDALGPRTVVGKVKLLYPQKVSLGRSCLLDDFVVVNAGGAGESRIKLGDRVVAREFAVLEAHKGWIEIGDDCFLGQRVSLYGQGGIKIGAKTMMAAGVLMISSNHRFDDGDRAYKDQGETSLGIEIGKNCWLGANVTVLDGVRLGSGTIVAAGSVVTKPWGERLLLAGLPAKPIKKFENGEWVAM